MGFTTNISQTGMFVATNHIYLPGTRLRVEVVDRGKSLVLESVVARALQVPAMFRGLEHQGVGLRFLRLEELFEELVDTEPGDGAPATALPREGPPASSGNYRGDPIPTIARGSSGAMAAMAPLSVDPFEDESPLHAAIASAARGAVGAPPEPRTAAKQDAGPASAGVAHVPRAANAMPPARTKPMSASNGAPPSAKTPRAAAFVVSFATRDLLKTCLAQEVQFGAVFVRHADPPPLGTQLDVEIRLEGRAEIAVLPSRVVRRETDDPAKGVGFTAELLDPNGAVSAVRRLLR
jgi:hypothetical protein